MSFSKNYKLVETWLSDTAERTLEERYLRTLLTQLLVGGRHNLPITVGRVQHMADTELSAANAAEPGGETHLICGYASDELRALVGKLHDSD